MSVLVPRPRFVARNLSPFIVASDSETRKMDFSHFPPTAELVEDLELLKHPEGGMLVVFRAACILRRRI